ncbi:MAG TPA: hypothetical protein VLF94_09005 [Chlamydiales bacterium]|nr:hypothetical protein [Chlamydiales bacterium]
MTTMKWADVERAFSRAVLLSFSRKKALLTFPVLVLCGVLTVFCRAVAFEAGDWVAMSLAFLPILLSSGVLLALGVLLIRIHIHEVKGLSLGLRRLITGSLDLILGTSYLSIPPILAYLFLWVALGFFFLLKEIPGVGDFFGVVLAFGPFLLIFGSLLLCLFNLSLLFFVAPATAFQPFKRVSLAKRVLGFFQGNLLSSIALFLLALVPIVAVTALLSLAALLTNVSFLTMDKSLTVALEWFFIMLPFCAILTPAVIFFFNFAAESYQLLQPKNA